MTSALDHTALDHTALDHTALDHLDLRDLVGLLTEEEQRVLRPLVLCLLSSRARPDEGTENLPAR